MGYGLVVVSRIAWWYFLVDRQFPTVFLTPAGFMFSVEGEFICQPLDLDRPVVTDIQAHGGCTRFAC